jgi:hypothetical protein
MCARPIASLAELAQDCGWMIKGKDGQPDRPNKSLVQRVLERLKKDKLVVKKGRYFVPTSEGKTVAKGSEPQPWTA